MISKAWWHVRFFAAVLVIDVASASLVCASGLPRVLEVSATSLADGLTVVTVHSDSEFEARHWTKARLSDPARVVVRLKSFGPQLPTMNIDVDDALLDRIRLGFHPEVDPPEVHLVMDLVSEDIEVAQIRPRGSDLLIYLVGEQAPQASQTEVVKTSSPNPPPVPQAETQGVPAPSDPSDKQPADDWPPPIPQRKNLPEAPSVEPTFQARLVEFVATPRGDGTTSIRITTDRPLSTRAFDSYRVGEDPPYHVVSLSGVDPDDFDMVIPPDDPNIADLRIESKQEATGSRTDLVLDLRQSNVEVTRLVQDGVHLVLLLERIGPQ